MTKPIWNKLGFILSSRQRIEVFHLVKECRTIKEVESRTKETKYVKRILKDFENEGLLKIKDEKIELTNLGKKVMKKISEMRLSL